MLLAIGIISFSQTFAQHHGNDRRVRSKYVYASRPYNHSSVGTSVSVIARLPFGSVAVTLGGRHYHYNDGIYYEPFFRGGYVIAQPPVGIVIPALPPNAVYVMIGGMPYYRYQSVYYLPLDNNRYQVVAEPKEEEVTRFC